MRRGGVGMGLAGAEGNGRKMRRAGACVRIRYRRLPLPKTLVPPPPVLANAPLVSSKSANGDMSALFSTKLMPSVVLVDRHVPSIGNKGNELASVSIAFWPTR